MANALDRLRRALAGSYSIEREIGRGGMATVYLAHDSKHDRSVALKVLRPELSAAVDNRFLREISITARLDHPHILPLLDSGAAAGALYYVMPFVEGETLRDRIAREKQLPIDDALRITLEVADALGYAHAQGIIHRDIKPENILMSGGHARVADFGIARALTLVEQSLTATGVSLGTPAYMSPEQGTGEREVDGRSDLYSLGCVLFEMLAGEPPHNGATAQAILSRRIAEPAPSVSVLRDTVPHSVDQALKKVLARTPADRYSTAEQFADALALDRRAVSKRMTGRAFRRWTASLGTVAAGVTAATLIIFKGPSGLSSSEGLDSNRLAALPYRVTAPDTTHNYLREGAVDVLNARLTGDRNLRGVDSRTVLSRWRRAVAEEGGELTEAQALELASEMGAGRVLLGELLITPTRTTHIGRLLSVPDGTIIAENTETVPAGEVDAVVLIERGVARLLAAAQRTERPPPPPPPGQRYSIPDANRLYRDDRSPMDSVRIVISDVETFRRWWQQATSETPEPRHLMPTIDFSREMVLLVSAGRSYAGDRIQVDSIGSDVTSSRGGWYAVVRTIPDCDSFPGVAYPLEFVRVPKASGPFEFIERAVPCSGA